MGDEALKGIKITKKVRSKAGEQVAGMLDDYQEELNKAYKLAGNGALDVTFKVTFDAAANDAVKIKAAMGFVLEKVKDSSECLVSNQPDLFEEPEQEKKEYAPLSDTEINKVLKSTGWSLRTIMPPVTKPSYPDPANQEWARNGQRNARRSN